MIFLTNPIRIKLIRFWILCTKILIFCINSATAQIDYPRGIYLSDDSSYHNWGHEIFVFNRDSIEYYNFDDIGWYYGKGIYNISEDSLSIDFYNFPEEKTYKQINAIFEKDCKYIKYYFTIYNKNRQPLENITINSKCTNEKSFYGTTSDKNGKASIFCIINDTLISINLSYIGIPTRKYNLKKDFRFNIFSYEIIYDEMPEILYKKGDNLSYKIINLRRKTMLLEPKDYRVHYNKISKKRCYKLLNKFKEGY